MQVLITIELLGRPGDEAYAKVSGWMQETLGWEIHVTGVTGTVAPLPKAIFAGETKLRLIDLANKLLAQITDELWSDSARVLATQLDIGFTIRNFKIVEGDVSR